MTPAQFVEELCSLGLMNVFNPYSDRCAIHDVDDAPRYRVATLLGVLGKAVRQHVHSIWIGRDLGYRGGRRTGIAFTDDIHIHRYADRWGLSIQQPTKGHACRERTATVVWRVLSRVDVSVFLWNVFPLHPHEPGNPFSNRSHSRLEREVGERFLMHLIQLVEPAKIVAIGNDAARVVFHLCGDREVEHVRHPSYGGQRQFVSQMCQLYPVPCR